MNASRLLDTFSELVALDSPTFHERPVLEYLSKRLTALGLTVIEDGAADVIGGDCGNLYARLDGDSQQAPLLFSAHMDTVRPAQGKRAVFHSDGTITSAGDTVLGADDLAGVSAILEALETVIESGSEHRTIEILFTAAEEVFCKGAAAFDFGLLRSKEVYVFDLNGPVGSAANKAPTIISFTATVTGRAAHAGLAPQDGIHAIAIASRAVSRLNMGRRSDETTLNVGTIGGGSALNIVPELCVVKGEIRGYRHEDALSVLQEAQGIFETAAKELGGKAEFTSDCSIKAYELKQDSGVVLRFKNACKRLDLPFALIPTFGGSDNNVFSENDLSGLVAACGMNNCHTCAEFTTVSELTCAAALAVALMTDLTF